MFWDRARCLAAIHYGHSGVANCFKLARFNGRFNALDIEEHTGIALRTHHVFVVHTVFNVVLIGTGQLAVVLSRYQIHVAIYAALPAHFHFSASTQENSAPYLVGSSRSRPSFGVGI